MPPVIEVSGIRKTYRRESSENRCHAVLAQPEMEKRRSPLVSIPPFGGDFQGMGSFDPMGFWAAEERILTPPVHRLDEPTGLSLGMVASPQCPLPFRPARSL